MTALKIDGKAIAADLRLAIAQDTAGLTARHGLAPGLAVVLVGNDPASTIYVNAKHRDAQSVGMRSIEVKLPADSTLATVLSHVARLNADPNVHGILVQLPLPPHLDPNAVIAAIDPDKDVDGLHPVNAGRLSSGLPGMVPCTPYGCLLLIKRIRPQTTGLEAVMVGRSNLMGKPMAQLLLSADMTVSLAHSKSRDLASICRRADVLVVAVGRAEMVRGDWIKPGATVIDVGMNRIDLPDGKSKLKGDVCFAEAEQVAGAITPVPGGVGPMTIACLLRNTLVAAGRAFDDQDLKALNA
jgi:methylenetetrahydrofolate dehydrogenase (NADP+)/methenyltetrahydrofolate cyclohydrolase